MAVSGGFRRVAVATGDSRGGEGGAAAGASRLTVGDQTRHFRVGTGPVGDTAGVWGDKDERSRAVAKP